MSGTAGTPDPAEVAGSLRAVLAAIDAGEIGADEAQRAYLSGAADALGRLESPATSEE